MLNHDKNPHHSFMVLWIAGALVVLGIGMVGYTFNHPPKVLAPEIESVQETLSTATNLVLGLGETGESQGISITVTEVLEDSRCPANVQCVQPGTVRLQSSVTTDSGTGTLLLVLNEISTTETKNITLTGVSPENPVEGEYRFLIHIVSR